MIMVAEETTKPDEYMTLKEVAALLKVSKRTVRRLISECEIPAPIMRRGRLMLWRLEQFERWSKRRMEKRK